MEKFMIFFGGQYHQDISTALNKVLNVCTLPRDYFVVSTFTDEAEMIRFLLCISNDISVESIFVFDGVEVFIHKANPDLDSEEVIDRYADQIDSVYENAFNLRFKCLSYGDKRSSMKKYNDN